MKRQTDQLITYRILIKGQMDLAHPDPSKLARSYSAVLVKWLQTEVANFPVHIESISLFPRGLGIFLKENGEVGSFNNRLNDDFVSAEIKIQAVSLHHAVEFTSLIPWFGERHISAELVEDYPILMKPMVTTPPLLNGTSTRKPL